MKINELMNKLERLMGLHGNVDVFAVRGCGCCDGEVDPEPAFYTKNEYDFIYSTPEGVYLN